MHLPPQAAGPNRSRFSYNTQTQPPEEPRSNAE
ncbi:replication protein, partial [Escherichia coli]|nr:replication protein [Escherichia coli]